MYYINYIEDYCGNFKTILQKEVLLINLCIQQCVGVSLMIQLEQFVLDQAYLHVVVMKRAVRYIANYLITNYT